MKARVACLLFFLSLPAWADTRSVDLVILGDKSDTALVDSVRELLGRLGLVVGTGVKDPTARVEVDLRSDKEATITIESADGTVKRVVRRAASPTVAREEIAHAIQTGVEAQLFPHEAKKAPEPIKAVPATPPPQTTEPAPAAVVINRPPIVKEAPAPPLPRSPVALDTMFRAGAGGLADSTGPNARIGGLMRLAYRKGLSPSILTSFDVGPPVDSSSRDEVTARASALLFRSMLEIEPIHTQSFALATGIGGGIDALTVEPRSATLPPAYLKGSTTRVLPIVSASVSAHIALSSRFALTFVGLADFDVGATQNYSVEVEGVRRDLVFSPWRVRPAFLAGLTFTPFGPGAAR